MFLFKHSRTGTWQAAVFVSTAVWRNEKANRAVGNQRVSVDAKSCQDLDGGRLFVDKRLKSYTRISALVTVRLFCMQRTKGLEQEEGTGGKDCSETKGLTSMTIPMW